MQIREPKVAAWIGSGIDLDARLERCRRSLSTMTWFDIQRFRDVMSHQQQWQRQPHGAGTHENVA